MYVQENREKCERVNGSLNAGSVERVGEVSRQVDIAAKLTEILNESIRCLMDRMSEVMRSEPPRGTESEKDVGCATNLAEAMRINNRRIEAAIENITSLIERCEL